MGLGGYLNTYKVYEVTDYHPDGNQYQRGTLEISVDIYGALTWKLTMNNGVNGSSDGKGRAVGLYLDIDGNLLYNSYTDYTPNNNTPLWNTFPTGNNTSASGSFTVGSGSFNVTLGISCMQSNVSANGETTSETFDREYWDNITNGSPPVIENTGDNTFKIIGYKGNSAHNNSITASQLEWTVQSDEEDQDGWLVYNGKYFTSDFTETETEKELNLSFSDIDKDYGGSYSVDNATRGVKARVINYGERGDITFNAYVSEEIGQYFSPNPPGIPALTPSSYKNGRLTIRNNWTFKWSAATGINDSCPVVGYRIQLYKRTDDGWLGVNLTNAEGNDYWYDTSYVDGDVPGHSSLVDGATYETLGNECLFTINPEKFNFIPGEEIRLTVFSYSRNGNNTQLISDEGKESPEYIVENSGVLHIRDSNAWKEGQVYVYDDGWKEATTVYVRDNNEWKEST